MSDDRAGYDDSLSGEGLRCGVVQARFNGAIVGALRERCVAELIRLGVAEDDIEVVSVPGALEIPLALKLMAESDDFDALIALGCVVRGETYHFEIVCNESARGVGQVQLETGVPIANAILTVEDDAQAQARLDKGTDAARVAIEMALLASELTQ
ncbi:MAG: 6,7-dimethyl-8-ribityllumazine synthase [Burkholderiales bacterium]|nr:6,7-dimethyl-8-ribityllumazine synthase [Burkholderiales bacterium]